MQVLGAHWLPERQRGDGGRSRAGPAAGGEGHRARCDRREPSDPPMVPMGPGSPTAPAAGMTAEGKAWAGVVPETPADDAREGQGLCRHHMAARAAGAVPPSVPGRGHLPLKGGEGRVWPAPGNRFARPEPAHGIRTARPPHAVTPDEHREMQVLGAHWLPERQRGDGGRSRAGPAADSEGLAPAATGGANQIRRGCQWVPALRLRLRPG